MNKNDTKGAMSVNEFLHWSSIGRTKFMMNWRLAVESTQGWTKDHRHHVRCS